MCWMGWDGWTVIIGHWSSKSTFAPNQKVFKAYYQLIELVLTHSMSKSNACLGRSSNYALEMMVVVAVVEEKLEGESTTDVRLRFPPRSTEPPTCLRFSTRCPSTSNVRLPTGASLLTSFSHFFHFPNTESPSVQKFSLCNWIFRPCRPDVQRSFRTAQNMEGNCSGRSQVEGNDFWVNTLRWKLVQAVQLSCDGEQR